MKRALIVVDLQNDFVPGGALAVRGGDEIVPAVNALMPRFELVVATQDWHPRDHGSFAANHPGRSVYELGELNGLPQVLWPVHCVQGTAGAGFVPGLAVGKIEKIFPKGTDPGIDSYSGLFDNGHRKSTGLGEHLRAEGVTDVYVVGIATDYCVKFTALDAKEFGFNTHLVTDACRGVDLKPGDVDRAIEELRAAGVNLVESGSLLAG